jgi:hypothetical protein
MKNAVFFDVTPYGSCKNRRFGGAYRLHHQGDKNRQARNDLQFTINLNLASLDPGIYSILTEMNNVCRK